MIWSYLINKTIKMIGEYLSGYTYDLHLMTQVNLLIYLYLLTCTIWLTVPAQKLISEVTL